MGVVKAEETPVLPRGSRGEDVMTGDAGASFCLQAEHLGTDTLEPGGEGVCGALVKKRRQHSAEVFLKVTQWTQYYISCFHEFPLLPFLSFTSVKVEWKVESVHVLL